MAYLRFTSLAGIALIIGATLPALGQDAKPSVTAKAGEWRYLNSDPMATRYSPLDQITKDNFKDLKLAWRWKPAIGPRRRRSAAPRRGTAIRRLRCIEASRRR